MEVLEPLELFEPAELEPLELFEPAELEPLELLEPAVLEPLEFVPELFEPLEFEEAGEGVSGTSAGSGPPPVRARQRSAITRNIFTSSLQPSAIAARAA